MVQLLDAMTHMGRKLENDEILECATITKINHYTELYNELVAGVLHGLINNNIPEES